MCIQHAVAREGAGLRDGQDFPWQEQLAIAQSIDREKLFGIDVETAGNTVREFTGSKRP